MLDECKIIKAKTLKVKTDVVLLDDNLTMRCADDWIDCWRIGESYHICSNGNWDYIELKDSRWASYSKYGKYSCISTKYTKLGFIFYGVGDEFYKLIRDEEIQAVITLNDIGSKKRANSCGKYWAYVTISIPERWLCKCGKYNVESFCTKCGSKRQEETKTQEKISYWICPSCGDKRQESEMFCGKCGTKKLNVSDDHTEQKRESDVVVSSSSYSGGMEETFNHALNLKRDGKYNESIKCYMDYIRKYYNDDSQIQRAFIALGKVYYLKGEYKSSLLCYDAFIALTARPEIETDYKDIISGRATEIQTVRFIQFFSNIARHIGHAILDDANENNVGCTNYKKSLKGESVDVIEVYEKECQKKGMCYIENIIKGGFDMGKINRMISECVAKVVNIA